MDNKTKITALLSKIKNWDKEEFRHAIKVHALVNKMLTKIPVPELEKQIIKEAAILHDIGKMSIDDSILNKPASLTADEYEIVQTHVNANAYISGLEHAAAINKIIRHHHENVNGFGYPNGLVGNQIPLGSRLIHVAEAYDAMINSRLLKKIIFSSDMAKNEIKRYSGRMYDPKVVKIFLDVIEEFEEWSLDHDTRNRHVRRQETKNTDTQSAQTANQLKLSSNIMMEYYDNPHIKFQKNTTPPTEDIIIFNDSSLAA